MSGNPTPRCRNCGCYDYVHAADYEPWGDGRRSAASTHRFSRATRLELWFRDHGTIWKHVKAWTWLNLRSSRSRMLYIERLHRRHPDLCWCQLVDAWWYAEPQMRSDYDKGGLCVCDFPLPSTAGKPEGNCYCEEPEAADVR